jgi:hypothetical protein
MRFLNSTSMVSTFCCFFTIIASYSDFNNHNYHLSAIHNTAYSQGRDHTALLDTLNEIEASGGETDVDFLNELCVDESLPSFELLQEIHDDVTLRTYEELHDPISSAESAHGTEPVFDPMFESVGPNWRVPATQLGNSVVLPRNITHGNSTYCDVCELVFPVEMSGRSTCPCNSCGLCGVAHSVATKTKYSSLHQPLYRVHHIQSNYDPAWTSEEERTFCIPHSLCDANRRRKRSELELAMEGDVKCAVCHVVDRKCAGRSICRCSCGYCGTSLDGIDLHTHQLRSGCRSTSRVTTVGDYLCEVCNTPHVTRRDKDDCDCRICFDCGQHPRGPTKRKRAEDGDVGEIDWGKVMKAHRLSAACKPKLHCWNKECSYLKKHLTSSQVWGHVFDADNTDCLSAMFGHLFKEIERQAANISLALGCPFCLRLTSSHRLAKPQKQK